MSMDAIKEEMSRLSKKGKVTRLEQGIYLIDSGRIDRDVLEMKSIFFRYIESGKNVYGFFYGENFIRYLKGLPLLKKIEIVTNKVTSGKKESFQFGRRVVLRKPYVKITKRNVTLLSFLTYISFASEEKIKEDYSILANYVRVNRLSAPEAVDLLTKLPGKTSKKLLSSGFYKLMWKH